MPVTVALAVSVRVTSAASSNSVTASLKTTVNSIGLVLVGSDWLPDWLIVTVGEPGSYITECSRPAETGTTRNASQIRNEKSTNKIDVRRVMRRMEFSSVTTHESKHVKNHQPSIIGK